jgi:hypothetical protein
LDRTIASDIRLHCIIDRGSIKRTHSWSSRRVTSIGPIIVICFEKKTTKNRPVLRSIFCDTSGGPDGIRVRDA